MFRIVASLLTLGILGVVVGTGQAAAPQADAVMMNLVNNAPTPHSFEAATSLSLKQRGFPWARVNLQGTSYFQAPNRLVVNFTKVPGYMSGLPQAYAKILNIGAWPEQYNAKLGNPKTVDGHTDYALELTPKSGSTDRGVAMVNPTDWSVEQVTWMLSGGVQLSMAEHYANVQSYRVPSSQSVSVRTPYATADGTAQLRDYVVNVPISERVFVQKQKQKQK